jgi:hypothetical protein
MPTVLLQVLNYSTCKHTQNGLSLVWTNNPLLSHQISNVSAIRTLLKLQKNILEVKYFKENWIYIYTVYFNIKDNAHFSQTVYLRLQSQIIRINSNYFPTQC